jgi:hypothetical protein
MIKTVEQYLKEHQIEDKVSLFYHKPSTDETFLYREDVMMLAASTIKVPVVMAWMDLIRQNQIAYETRLEYCERHYEESDAKALYDTYGYGDKVPLKECMELAIVYSDNPSNHMMREYIKDYLGISFREWFAQFSEKTVNEEFYTRNLMNAGIMLNVMKRLYAHQEQYSLLISWMKDAAKGKSFTVSSPRRGVKEATLSYSVLAEGQLNDMPISFVHVQLHTGRFHHIRCQFASRRHPLLGDGKYGSRERGCTVALWSHRITFRHPTSKKPCSFTLSPPDAFPWNIFTPLSSL